MFRPNPSIYVPGVYRWECRAFHRSNVIFLYVDHLRAKWNILCGLPNPRQATMEPFSAGRNEKFCLAQPKDLCDTCSKHHGMRAALILQVLATPVYGVFEDSYGAM